MLLDLPEYVVITGRTLSEADALSAQAVLAEVDDAVKRILRQPIERAQYTRVLPAPPTERLALPYTPVSGTSLQVWFNGGANGDSAAFTSDHLLTRYTDYDLEITTPDGLSGTGHLLCLTGVWGGRWRREPTRLAPALDTLPGAVKVTWYGGYTLVPQAIKAAVALATTRIMLMRKTGLVTTSASLNGASFGGQVAGTGGALDDPTVLGLLRPWLPAFVSAG